MKREDRPAGDGPRPPFKKKAFGKPHGAPGGKKPFAKKPFKAKAQRVG